MPAVKKYAKWRKVNVSKLAGGALLSETILSPLGVKDRLGDLTAIRHPMFANKDLTAKAQKYRSVCQAINLLSSFAILGIIIYQRKQTQKKHELAKEEIKKQLELEKTKKENQPEMAVA